MGCKNQQDANEKDLLTIHIEDYENKVIPRPAVVSSIDTIALNTCGNFMGDIKTVCISDSMVYVLDRANAVWASNSLRAISSNASGTWDMETENTFLPGP